MSDFLSSVTLLAALTLLAVVTLATVSAALIWEGVRRWLRSLAAARALRAVARKDEEVRGAGGARPSILSEDPDASVPAWLEPILLRLPHRDDLQRLLDRAASTWSVATVILFSIGVAAALGLSSSILARSPLIPLLLAGIGACLPVGYLKFKAHRRLRAFEENFGEAIDLLARAARATPFRPGSKSSVRKLRSR